MFYHQFIIFTLFLLIGFKNINCDIKNITEVKNFIITNSNSSDLAKHLIDIHEGASSNITKKQSVGKKEASLNQTTTISPVTKIDELQNSNNTKNNLTTLTTTTTLTSRPSQNIPQVTETAITDSKDNVSTTTKNIPTVILKDDVAVLTHKSREGVTSKPDEVHTKIAQNENKTTSLPTISNKNVTNNNTTVSPTVAKNNSLVNSNKTNEKLISTTQLPNSTSSLSLKSSTVVTTTTIPTKTTTTPKYQKPKILYSIEDMPAIAKVETNKVKPLISSTNMTKNNLQIVDEPIEQPNAEPSREIDDVRNGHRDYILPIVGLIFVIPIVMGFLIISYRKFNDYWSTRHYRRMDFLVDGMYND